MRSGPRRNRAIKPRGATASRLLDVVVPRVGCGLAQPPGARRWFAARLVGAGRPAIPDLRDRVVRRVGTGRPVRYGPTTRLRRRGGFVWRVRLDRLGGGVTGARAGRGVLARARVAARLPRWPATQVRIPRDPAAAGWLRSVELARARRALTPGTPGTVKCRVGCFF